MLGHGHIPFAAIGYGYPILLAPLALIGGSSLVAGLPLVVALNMLVLWPVALLCVYGISKAIGGRGFAYLATLAWVVFPLASIPYFYGRYHVKLVDQTLPSALGLVATGDFPSMVLLLVAAYFALRAISAADPRRGRRRARRRFRADDQAGERDLPAGAARAPSPSPAGRASSLVFARRTRSRARRARALEVPRARDDPGLLALGGRARARRVAPPPVASISLHRYLPLDWGACATTCTRFASSPGACGW